MSFQPATRHLSSFTAALESRVLLWLAHRLPRAVHSDHLTGLALAAMGAAGACYALARVWPPGLLLVNICLAVNWFGDSLDGTLARVRHRQRPRYGFYVDHVIDCVGAAMLLAGVALSGVMHPLVALALLAAYLLVSAEAYLATYTRHAFRMSAFGVGPTELRLLLAAANVGLFAAPGATGPGGLLWFDLAGAAATAGLLTALLVAIVRNTVALYREERLE